MEYQLLLVDADDSHRHSLSERLQEDGFSVLAARTVRAALDLTRHHWPHLALVDTQFPDGTAEDLAKRLTRHGDVPIVVLSAVSDGPTRARAIAGFADDYVGRPYHYDEVLARVRRVLRRTLLRADHVGDLVDLGWGVRLDPLRRQVHRQETVVPLTPTEARLLEYFLLNADRILPTDLILQRVWCDTPAGSNTLWEYVRRLRRKLGDDPDGPTRLKSVRGLGYRFCREAGGRIGTGESTGGTSGSDVG